MSLRLTVRMVAPTVAVSAALLLLGGVAAWYVNLLQRQSSQLLAEGITEVQAAEELELIGLELRNEVKRYLFMGDQTSVGKVLDSRKKVDHWLASAGDVAAKDPEKALLARIRQGYAHFYREFANITRDPSAKDHAQEIVASVHDLIGTEVLKPAQQYSNLSRQSVNWASQRDQVLARRMELGLLLLGACGAVAGLLLGYGITRGIHRSLVQLSVPIRDAAGKLNQVVGPITVSSDQTFKELESALQGMAGRIATVVQRLQEAHRAASRAERLAAMGQLAAGLAHELRNPLTSMKILIQSAAEGGDSVKLDDDDFEVLTQEITRLEHTIQVYLDYARPPTLERTPLVLRDVLQETVDLVSHRASQFHIQIDRRFPEEVIPVEADIGQIRQVLLNLLLNALDASPEDGTVRLRMRYEYAPESDGQPREREHLPRWVTIEVADDGPGLPAELGDRIFEPFVSTKEAGTGLGLAICRRIVEDHGGQITGVNQPEGGALFSFRLPVHAADSSPRRPEAGQPTGSSQR